MFTKIIKASLTPKSNAISSNLTWILVKLGNVPKIIKINKEIVYSSQETLMTEEIFLFIINSKSVSVLLELPVQEFLSTEIWTKSSILM